LLEETAALFLENIQDFSTHSTLRYQWVRYLSTEYVQDGLWSQLQQNLFEKLKMKPAFVSMAGGFLYPKDLRFVPLALRDGYGEPLLPDCDCGNHDEKYLSKEYDKMLDHPVLRNLGVTDLTTAEFIHRLEHDLNGPNSRMVATPHEDTWHSRTATVLVKAMENKEYSGQISRLPIIPLRNGRWVRPSNGTIYFPTCLGIVIPTYLPLSIVDPHTLDDPERVKLFQRLGVHECDPNTLFSLTEEATTRAALQTDTIPNPWRPLVTAADVIEDALHNQDSDEDSDTSVGRNSIFSVNAHSIPSETSTGLSEVTVAAANDFVRLLHEDEALNRISKTALQSHNIGRQRFQRNFRRLLQYFAINLSKEARTKHHHVAYTLVYEETN
jgi:hypothetical protein